MPAFGIDTEQNTVSGSFTPDVEFLAAIFRGTIGNVSISDDGLVLTNSLPTTGSDAGISNIIIDLTSDDQAIYFTLPKSQFADGDSMPVIYADNAMAPSELYFVIFTYNSATDNFDLTIGDQFSVSNGSIDISGSPYNGELISFFINDNGDVGIKVGGTASSPAYQLAHTATTPTLTNFGFGVLYSSGIGSVSSVIDFTLLESPAFQYDDVTLISDPGRGGPLINAPSVINNNSYVIDETPVSKFTEDVGFLIDGDIVNYIDGILVSKLSNPQIKVFDFVADWATGVEVDPNDITTPSGDITSRDFAEILTHNILTPLGIYLNNCTITQVNSEVYNVESTADDKWSSIEWTRTIGGSSDSVGVKAGTYSSNKIAVQAGDAGILNIFPVRSGSLTVTPLTSPETEVVMSAPGRIRIKGFAQ